MTNEEMKDTPLRGNEGYSNANCHETPTSFNFQKHILSGIDARGYDCCSAG